MPAVDWCSGALEDTNAHNAWQPNETVGHNICGKKYNAKNATPHRCIKEVLASTAGVEFQHQDHNPQSRGRQHSETAETKEAPNEFQLCRGCAVLDAGAHVMTP